MTVWCKLVLLFLVLSVNSLEYAVAREVFAGQSFTKHDSVLVVDTQGNTVFEWQADVERVPASVTKLFTVWLAIEKWGLDHHFETNLYVDGNTLWVKGSGDPMLISEELDLLVAKIQKQLPESIDSLGLDSSLFADVPIPGKGQTIDPYNAPLSALAINFNTVSVLKSGGILSSGEPQTPLTAVAKSLVSSRGLKLGSKPSRVNLRSAKNAQRQFAEVLIAKLGSEKIKTIQYGPLPNGAELFVRHKNSHSLKDVLRGSLEYSNNFIANQLFMLMASAGNTQSLTLAEAQISASVKLQQLTGWPEVTLFEGAGLSRENKFTAQQVLTVLHALEPHKKLLKDYPLRTSLDAKITAFAKSGTLSGVHTLAGYLNINDADYKFVFLFNKPKPFRYRESLLQNLADQLSSIR